MKDNPLQSLLQPIDYMSMAAAAKAASKGPNGAPNKMSKDLAKLGRGSSAVGTSQKSQTGKSSRSGATRKSATATSYKSRAETNYEELDIMEIEIEYETTEKELQSKLRDFNKLSGSATLRRAPLKSREMKL